MTRRNVVDVYCRINLQPYYTIVSRNFRGTYRPISVGACCYRNSRTDIKNDADGTSSYAFLVSAVTRQQWLIKWNRSRSTAMHGRNLSLGWMGITLISRVIASMMEIDARAMTCVLLYEFIQFINPELYVPSVGVSEQRNVVLCVYKPFNKLKYWTRSSAVDVRAWSPSKGRKRQNVHVTSLATSARWKVAAMSITG